MRQGLGHKCEVAGQGPFVLLNVCHLSNADHACVGCVVSYSNTDVTMPVAWSAAVVWGLRWRWLLAWKWSPCNIYLLHVLCAQITILSSAITVWDTVQIATCPYTVAVRYCANRHLSIYCHCEILCKLTPCYLQILRMLLLVQLAVLWLTNSFCTCFVTCKLPPCHLPWLYMYVSCANDYPSIYSHCKTYILCTLP